MKRILTLLMAVSLLLCLAACGKPTGSTPEQTPQQTESSDPPAQTEPPALEGEALSILPAEDAGLTEGGYDAYREEDPMAEIVLLPTRSVTDFHYFIVDFREDGDQLTLTRENDLYTADALSPPAGHSLCGNAPQPGHLLCGRGRRPPPVRHCGKRKGRHHLPDGRSL